MHKGDDGRKEAERARREAEAERRKYEAQKNKEKEKAQKLFMRQIRARQGGGFFDSGDGGPYSSTLG